MPEAFDVELPRFYFDAMRAFSWLQFDWLSIGVPNAACIGNFGTRLKLKALGPLAALTLLVSGSVLTAVLGLRRNADGSANRCVAAVQGGLHVLPLALLVLFALVPSVSARVFSTFSCERFGYNDALHEHRYFLLADMTVECSVHGVWRSNEFTGLAIAFVALWPVGVPLLFGTLLWASRRDDCLALETAVRFLHVEYIETRSYWEVVELLRKLLLTGFVFLIPQHYSLLRLIISLLVTVGHTALLIAAAPYRQPGTTFVAFGTAMALACTLLTALLVRVYSELLPEQVVGFFGFASAYTLAKTILAFNFAVVIVAVSLLLCQLATEGTPPTLRLRATGEPPVLALGKGKRWHVFLSHNWANQDVAATIKRQLQRLLPGVRAFLDVDDLTSIDELEAHVAASATVLILLGSPKYWSSINCLREVAAAETHALPLILVHDADPQKNGAPLADLEQSCPEAHHRYVFGGRNVIPWLRVSDFQLASLAQIGEQLLGARDMDPGTRSLCVRGGLAWARPALDAVAVHVSPDSADADAVRAALHSLPPNGPELVAVPPLSAASSMQWVLVLRRGCFGGEAGGRLAAELEVALCAGIQPVVVYAPEDAAFDELMNATPATLRDLGLFGPVAIEWRRGVHRAVSVNQLARALGARMQQTWH